MAIIVGQTRDSLLRRGQIALFMLICPPLFPGVLMIVGHTRQIAPRMTHNLRELLLHAVLGSILRMVQHESVGP